MIRVWYHAPNDISATQGVTTPSVRLEETDHGDATHVEVDGGSLYLYDDANTPIAGYAPGWVRWDKG